MSTRTSHSSIGKKHNTAYALRSKKRPKQLKQSPRTHCMLRAFCPYTLRSRKRSLCSCLFCVPEESASSNKLVVTPQKKGAISYGGDMSLNTGETAGGPLHVPLALWPLYMLELESMWEDPVPDRPRRRMRGLLGCKDMINFKNSWQSGLDRLIRLMSSERASMRSNQWTALKCRRCSVEWP